MSGTLHFAANALLLIGAEGAGNYGTPPTLNIANYLGLPVKTDVVPEHRGEAVQNDYVSGSRTRRPGAVGQKISALPFETPLKGCNDAVNPETETVLHRVLKGCGLVSGSWSWADSAGANATTCDKIWWLELANADNCHETAPFQSLWLVEDAAGTPVNRKAHVVGMIRRKDSDGDASQNDCLLVALDDDATPALDKTKTQDIQADNANAPDGTTFLSVADVAGTRTMNKGSALMPASDYQTNKDGSLALAHFLGGTQLHLIPGALGSALFEFNAGQYPAVRFSFQGLFNQPVDQAPPSGPSLFSHTAPTVCNTDLILATESSGALTDVYRAGFERMALDLNSPVEAIKNGAVEDCIEEVFLGDRDMAGGIDPKVDALSNFNPWAAWGDGSTRVVTGCFGYQTVGNRVAFCLPAAAHDTEIRIGNGNKFANYELPINPRGREGGADDEFILFFG